MGMSFGYGPTTLSREEQIRVIRSFRGPVIS